MMAGWQRGPDPGGRSAQGGMSLVELLVTMVLLLVLVAATAPAFMSGHRGTDRPDAVQAVQGELHASTEFLVRAVRDARSVEEGSSPSTLTLRASGAGEACGVESDESFRIHLAPAGLRCDPLTEGPTTGRLLASSVETLNVSFGVDLDGDGRVDTFVADPSDLDPGDILAIRFQLDFAGIGPGASVQTTADFVAALRDPISSRGQLGAR